MPVTFKRARGGYQPQDIPLNARSAPRSRLPQMVVLQILAVTLLEAIAMVILFKELGIIP
jgi:hypothetical protein